MTPQGDSVTIRVKVLLTLFLAYAAASYLLVRWHYQLAGLAILGAYSLLDLDAEIAAERSRAARR
jgi:hypothetical protein